MFPLFLFLKLFVIVYVPSCKILLLGGVTAGNVDVPDIDLIIEVITDVGVSDEPDIEEIIEETTEVGLDLDEDNKTKIIIIITTTIPTIPNKKPFDISPNPDFLI